MDNQTFSIDRIISGIENLDRAQREIEMIITRLVRIADDECHLRVPSRRSPHPRWRIVYDDKGVISIGRRGYATLYTRKRGYAQPSVMMTQQVRADLQELFNEMGAIFSSLTGRFGSWERAADLY